jgi:hypothetical protein
MVDFALPETPGLLLEICYPTYNRQETCIQNVSNLIMCKDPRFGVYMSSNGPAPKIREFQVGRSNVRVHEFPENRGFSANVEFLLETANARYALLMSDEDTISEENLINLLNFLQDSERFKALFYVPTQTSMSLGNLQNLSGKNLDFRNLMLTHPMNPTYMSGYIFPTTQCKKENIEVLFKGGVENAYPFLKLRNKVLKDGYDFILVSHITISQGPSHHIDGASTAELSSRSSRINQYLHFTSLSQQHVASSKFLRFTSNVLIANQIQNDMGSRIYFTLIEKPSFGKRRWSIRFVESISIHNVLSLILSQILIKSVQKFSGLYRLVLSRSNRHSRF